MLGADVSNTSLPSRGVAPRVRRPTALGREAFVLTVPSPRLGEGFAEWPGWLSPLGTTWKKPAPKSSVPRSFEGL